MKLGCAIHTLAGQPPYEGAMRTIARLGFSGFELIAFSRDELREYYTARRCAQLRDLARDLGLELTQFILYAPLVEGLASRDGAQRRTACDIFAQGMEKAAALGTDIVNIVSNWPNELKAPIDYPPAFVHPAARGVTAFDPKLKMELPANFDAQGVWDTYMQSLGALADMAQDAGLRFALEGHANVIVSTTDAFLRMFDRIPHKCFGANFDACWQLVQREYLPWSVYKLRQRIFHVHVRDGDGMGCYALQPGSGIIHWPGLVRALKEVGYQGYLSFETGGYADPIPHLAAGKAYLEAVLLQEGALDARP